MPDPDLSDVPDGPAVFPSDRKINSTEYLLSEIKRILWYDNQQDIRKRDEEAFVAFTTGDVASGGGTINLHLKNPTSDRSIEVRRFIISTQFRGQYKIFDEFSSAPSSGTDAGIDNLLMDEAGGAADTGNMNINEGVSFTESGTHFEAQIPSGGASGNSIGGRGEATEPIIEPGREIVVQLINDSANTRPGSIGVVFEEEPFVYSTQ